MSDKPAATPDGYCTNTEPVSGTTEQVNGLALGGKFVKMHGRRYADCPCGRRVSLTDRATSADTSSRRNSPTDAVHAPPRYGGVDGPPRPARHWPTAAPTLAPSPSPSAGRQAPRPTPSSPEESQPMTSLSLTIDTPAGPVRATAGPRDADAVVFELGGAMRGSVHVTGTTDPHHWDQFTAVRACLGPVNAFKTTAPDEDLPRLANGRTGYHGSLTLYRDSLDRPEVSVYPLFSAADHPPSQKTAAVLTAVLRGCAEHVEQRADLPAILEASRQRDTPGLLRFLTWSASYHQAEAVRLEREARAALPARKAAEAAWRTAAQWLALSPHPVLLLMLADRPDSLTQKVRGLQWWAPYCVDAAAEERERAHRAQEEADSLRAQQRRRPRGRRPYLVGTP